ncbi:transcriptional regulator, TetR family [Variovorax sp. OK605]|uniref:TetR/AcrR family transcriptional regulator C-terminal domain-containing protein n=1 Tax=Variovorax sp. OK605 TaxID=1855317 RepID=UPI0008F4394D|nr:TetR/AcrR family transcriptional regulator C-terminal domain-containing protein [Variovorax sp. OK605]SFP24292.1 transcriptional regulator, TetR family [Variovorax sp. OK605]
MRIQRDQIIATALVLLDENGLDGLTMRALALALQVQAPSLYWHFPNKKALIDGMADALVEGVARTPAANVPWQEAIRTVGQELRQGLLAHRDGARVYAGTYVTSDNTLRMGEAMVAPLLRAGASPKLAGWGSFSMMYYVLGFVMEEQALWPADGVDAIENKAEFLALSQQRFPSVFACADALFDTDLEERFALGLDVFIAGLAHRIKASKRA